MIQQTVLRVVGIDPTSSGFAYAVFDGPCTLTDFGLVHCVLPTDDRVLARVGKALNELRPKVVVLEDGRGSRRRPRARRLIKAIATAAKKRKITVTYVSRSLVRSVFEPATTKHEIAEVLAHRFPALMKRLPPPRKAWMPEDERMSIFDAVSFALASFSK